MTIHSVEVRMGQIKTKLKSTMKDPCILVALFSYNYSN